MIMTRYIMTGMLLDIHQEISVAAANHIILWFSAVRCALLTQLLGMASAQIVVASLLSFISLIFTCAMLAGSSDDCNVVKKTAWGHKELLEEGFFIEDYGTTTACITVKDLGLVESKKLMGECKDAGEIANGFIGALLCLNLVVFGLSLMRIFVSSMEEEEANSAPKHSTSPSLLRTAAIILTLLAVLCSIAATGHFYRVCLEDQLDNADPGISIIFGAVTMLTLTLSASLHAIVV